jgi:hypothetical protein
MELILLNGGKDKNWSSAAVSKIIKSIDSCECLGQLMTCRYLVNNFMFASIISGKESDDRDLILISSLLHFLIKTKETQLITEMVEEIDKSFSEIFH